MREYLTYKDSDLYIEDVGIKDLAKNFKTPLYVYSFSEIERRFNQLTRACIEQGVKHLICFSLKSNSSYGIISFLRSLGAGADVVSGGELFRALNAGFSPKKIVFSGVGKTEEDIEYAIKKGVLVLNIESQQEFEDIVHITEKLKIKQNIGFRIKFDFENLSVIHPNLRVGEKASKFALSESEVRELFKESKKAKYVNANTLHFHIGSQILDMRIFEEASKRTKDFISTLDANIEYIDAGGGLGIAYKAGDEEPEISNYIKAVTSYTKHLGKKIIFEIGRAIVGPAGIIIGKVLYEKKMYQKRYIITDIGMTELIRPTLYNASHEVIPARIKDGMDDVSKADIVGPICENSDFIRKDISFQKTQKGDLIVVLDAGAYGHCMSSHYNSRLHTAEVGVIGKKSFLIRKRDTYKDIIKNEIKKKINIKIKRE